MDKSDTAVPPISPSTLILVCILGAVVGVILCASLYRLCRRQPTEDELIWNPNLRNKAQDAYMEEVRWRNNANAWVRAREDSEYKRGWFQEHLDEQRAKERSSVTPVTAQTGYDACSLLRFRIGLTEDRLRFLRST